MTTRFRNAVALGSASLVEGLKKRVKGNREQPARRYFEDRPTWGHVLAAVQRVSGGTWREYAGLYGDERRDLALYLARRVCGLTLRELGEKAGIDQYKTVGKAVERFGRLAEREPARATLVKRAMREISNVDSAEKV